MPGKHGGTLKRGGVHPNSGRRPAAIRKKALRMLANRMQLIGSLADGVAVEFTDEGATKLVSPKPSERLMALKLLAELGLGDQVPVSDVKDRLRKQLAVIRETLPPEQAAELILALDEVWK